MSLYLTPQITIANHIHPLLEINPKNIARDLMVRVTIALKQMDPGTIYEPKRRWS